MHLVAMLGLGFCTNLAQIFFVFFCWLSSSREMKSSHRFVVRFFALIWCADLCTDFCADFVRRFCAQIFAQSFRAQCADFCTDFAQIFLRRSGASKIGVSESRKNARKIC